MRKFFSQLVGLIALMLTAGIGRADHLSKIPSGSLLYDIQNPFVFIPRVQFENHFDTGIGPHDASNYRLRMRPIIPVDINEDWGLRTRTTVNMTYQSAIYPGGPNQLGFGDMDLEFYFTPNHSLAHDALVVGAGPSVHIPTATQNLIGLRQWGLGASAAVIWQPATIYALKGFTVWSNVNQSFGVGTGDGTRAMKFLFLQPGFSYTFASDVSLGLYSETAYNWNTDQWTVPINASVSTLVAPGGQNIVVTLAGRYYAERGLWDPQWGAQLNFNFLFP
jgi:hypothetical protein